HLSTIVAGSSHGVSFVDAGANAALARGVGAAAPEPQEVYVADNFHGGTVTQHRVDDEVPKKLAAISAMRAEVRALTWALMGRYPQSLYADLFEAHTSVDGVDAEAAANREPSADWLPPPPPSDVLRRIAQQDRHEEVAMQSRRDVDDVVGRLAESNHRFGAEL